MLERKILTEEVALRICYELWTWLSDDMEREKHSWPGWAEVEDTYRLEEDDASFYYDCPCCEYTCRQPEGFGNGCPNCPLRAVWPTAPGSEDERWYLPPCEWKGSPYKEWHDPSDEEQLVREPVLAKKIADAAKKRLEELQDVHPGGHEESQET